MSDAASSGPPPADKPKIRRAVCSQCGGERNCTVHGHYNYSHDEGTILWSDWYILQCRGCDHVFAIAAHMNSDQWDYTPSGETEFKEDVVYYPALSTRRRPDWVDDLAWSLDNVHDLAPVLNELYGALDNNLRMLAAIGIRTAFDVASSILEIDPNLTFKDKLVALTREGHIGVKDRDRINAMVVAGNAAAHRGWRPKPAELSAIMDILEHFVEGAIVAPIRREKLNRSAAKVSLSVPPKTPSVKKPKGKTSAPTPGQDGHEAD